MFASGTRMFGNGRSRGRESFSRGVDWKMTPDPISPDGDRDQRGVIREHAASKATDFPEERIEQFGCGLIAMRDDKLDQTIVPEFPALVAAGVGDAIGKEHQTISRVQRHVALRIGV